MKRKSAEGASKAAPPPYGEQQATRQLGICQEMIHSNNSLSQSFHEAELKFIADTFRDVQSSLQLDVAQSLRRVVMTNHVPKSLHMMHAPGCLPYDQVGARIDFQVRAGNYLTTSKKTTSESALFFQRSIQIIHSEHFYTHVGHRPWCAIPCTEPNNAFFILNYILPGVPRIHVICVYSASAETLAVIHEAQNAFRTHLQQEAAGAKTAGSITESTKTTKKHSKHHKHHSHLYPCTDEKWQGWRGLVARMFVGHSVSGTHHHRQHHDSSPVPALDGAIADEDANSSTSSLSPSYPMTPTGPSQRQWTDEGVAEGDDTNSNDNNSNDGSSSSTTSSVTSSGCSPVVLPSPSTAINPAELTLNMSEVDEEFLNSRLKLIPTMVEANWAVKMAVGQRPAILGTKIPLRYFKGSNYLEVDIDLSTSSIASGIMSMVTGLSKSMIVDLGWTLQGDKAEELPERIVCQTRFNKVDLEAGAEVEC
jgi:hypothetical protein